MTPQTFTNKDAQRAYNTGRDDAVAHDLGRAGLVDYVWFAVMHYPNNQRRARRAYLAGVASVIGCADCGHSVRDHATGCPANGRAVAAHHDSIGGAL